MKILVLGASDSAATSLADPSQAWPRILERELPPLVGAAVEVVHKHFFAHVQGSLEYLEKQLALFEPDVVLIAATAYGFSTPSVSIRISRIFGDGSRTWADKRFNAFDRATLRRGKAGQRVNRGAHWLARNTIGQVPHASVREVLAAYTAAMDRLAREESLYAVVLGATEHGAAFASRYPKMNAVIRQYNGRLKAVAAGHRFGWVEREALIAGTGQREDLYTDGLHKTGDFHRLIADALLPLIANTVPAAR